MTKQTVLGVRYPELVRVSPTGCTLGRFVPPDEDLFGGFLPVFWDTRFKASNWVSTCRKRVKVSCRESGWPSRYRAAISASPCGWMFSVRHLSARGRLSSLRRNLWASSVCWSPPVFAGDQQTIFPSRCAEYAQ